MSVLFDVARPRSVKSRANAISQLLNASYPDAVCSLDFQTPFQLLVATILSAQCTDERVNKVTPSLFAKYPVPEQLAAANPTDVEQLVRSTGFFRAKARSLVGMATVLCREFNGDVPTELDELVTLPGVGRKTGNVIRSVAFRLPGLPVDTHVGRLARRLRLTSEVDAVKVERELNELIAPDARGMFSLRLILHGRAVCTARRPACHNCVLSDLCPSAFVVEGSQPSKLAT